MEITDKKFTLIAYRPSNAYGDERSNSLFQFHEDLTPENLEKEITKLERDQTSEEEDMEYMILFNGAPAYATGDSLSGYAYAKTDPEIPAFEALELELHKIVGRAGSVALKEKEAEKARQTARYQEEARQRELAMEKSQYQQALATIEKLKNKFEVKP